MDDLQRLMIERECGRLATEYCHLFDHGEAAKMADLFTEDATLELFRGAEMVGRDAVGAGLRQRQASPGSQARHVCCNMLVNVIDEDHAEGVVYVTVYSHTGEPGRRTSPSGPPDRIGEYRDSFVRTPEGWRIKSRVAVATFVAETNA